MADDQQQIDPASANDAAPAIPGQAPQGNDQSSDWSATAPGTAPSDGSQLASTGAADNAAPPQTPAQTSAQFPFPGAQKPQAASDGGEDGGGPPGQSKPAYTPEQQAVVNKASWVHNVLQTISGGPQTKTVIDPNTGKSSQVQQPTSTKQLGLGLAIAALTGAFKGLGVANGPGNEGRAAAAGFGAELEQKQQQQQQQEQQASTDFARQAATTKANFQTRENNLRLANEDYDTQDKIMVQPSAALRDTARQNGDTIAQDVAPEDLLSQYHVTKDQAIPSKTVLVDDGNGGQRAKVLYDVLDPSKTGPMAQSIADQAAAFRIPGSYTTDASGKVVPKQFEGSAPVKYALQNQLTQATTSAMITQHLINQKLSELPDAPQVDIAKAFQDNAISTKALKAFSGYTGYTNIKEALDAFDKSKTNQDSGGVLGGQIRALFPGDTLQKIEKADADRQSAEQGARDTANKVAQEKALLPTELAKKAAEAKIETAAAYGRAVNETMGKNAAENQIAKTSGIVKDMVKNPNLYTIPATNEQPVNGANVGYLQSLQKVDPNLATLVQAVGEGRQLQSKYGLVKEDGQRFAAIVNRAYPGYSQEKGEAYDKLLTNFTSGPIADQITRGNTVMKHAAEYQAVSKGIGASTPLSTDRIKLNKAADVLTEELNGLYTKGVLHEGQRDSLVDGLKSFNPAYRQAAVDETLRLAGSKIGSLQEQFRAGKVSAAQGDFPIIREEAAKNYKAVTGTDAPQDWLGTAQVGTAPQQSTTSGPASNPTGNTGQAARAPFAPPAGSFAGRDASGKIVQWKTPNGIVDANGQPVAAK